MIIAETYAEVVMKSFFLNDIVVSKIHFANLVNGEVTYVHRDRKHHGFVAVFGGSLRFCFDDGRELTVGNGNILYLPQHSNYTNETLTEGSCYCINFSITDNVYNEPFVFTPRNLSSFETIFKTADRYWIAKREGYEIKCRSLLYDFLYYTRRELSLDYIDSGKLNIIMPAVDYIHEKYTSETINVDGLAKMCGVSYEYFRRLFRSFYNTTPITYINSMKISRAKELIDSGMYTITEAALASGYTDMSHFSREFKKVTGIAPSLYGKQP